MMSTFTQKEYGIKYIAELQHKIINKLEELEKQINISDNKIEKLEQNIEIYNYKINFKPTHICKYEYNKNMIIINKNELLQILNINYEISKVKFINENISN